MIIQKLNKKTTSPPALLQESINLIATCPQEDLPKILFTQWQWPKSDFVHWIKVLNRMDSIFEDMIKKYNLPNQSNPMSPEDCELLITCIQFQKLLWENATNRTLYNSYEHLVALICVFELEVVECAMQFLLKIAQKSSFQKALKGTFNDVFIERLDSFSKPLDCAVDLVAFVQGNVSSNHYFNYYPLTETKLENVKAAEDSSVFTTPASNTGRISITINQTFENTTDILNYFNSLVKTHNIDRKNAFDLFLKIRILALHGDEKLRFQWLRIRLIVMSLLTNIYNEDKLLKMYAIEPNLFANLMQILQFGHKDLNVSIITFFECSSHSRGKLNEVLSCMNASVNHGYLLSTMRQIVSFSEVDTSGFVETFLSFVGYLLSTQVGGNMIISAGIIPLLVSALQVKDPAHLKNVAKCTLMLDNLLYGFTASLNIFAGINGITTVVDRIEYEIEETYKLKDTVSPEELLGKILDRVITKEYRDLTARQPLLRATLKCILHLLQNAGNSDGIRNLIDSKLPRCIKVIFDNSELFGNIGTNSLAMNIMATFIHNEPTSLVVLQEQGLTRAFLEACKREMVPSAETTSAIPNAFGAICLNQNGLNEFMEANPIDNFLSIFSKKEHIRVLTPNDVPHLVGNSMDELMRHHPSLKESTMTSIMKMITTIVDMCAQEVPTLPEACELLKPDNMLDEKLERVEGNFGTLIEIPCRVLEGLFQNNAQCKEFAKYDGIPLLLNVIGLQALPYDFSNSASFNSLSFIFRLLLEANLHSFVDIVSKTLNDILDVTIADLKFADDFTLTASGLSKSVPDESKLARNDKIFRELIVVRVYMRLLVELFCSNYISHSKCIAAVLALFTDEGGTSLIKKLAIVSQFCLREAALLKQLAPSQWILISKENAEVDVIPEELIAKHGINPDAYKAPQSFACEWNSRMLYQMMENIPLNLLTCLIGIQRAISSKRVSESTSKSKIKELFGQISNILIISLSESAKDFSSIENRIYLKNVVTFIRDLLFEERASSYIIQTLQLLAFHQAGGIDELGKTLEAMIKANLELKDETLTSIIELVVVIFQDVTSEKKFHESNYTSGLNTRPRSGSGSESSVAFTFFIELRTEIVKILVSIWDSEAMVKLSSMASEHIIKTLNQIFKADGEEKMNGTGSLLPSANAAIGMMMSRVLQTPTVITPDPAKVGILCDMGFPRPAAETALRRCGNSVSRAADYLLNHPGIISSANEVPSATDASPGPVGTSDPEPAGVPSSSEPVVLTPIGMDESVEEEKMQEDPSPKVEEPLDEGKLKILQTFRSEQAERIAKDIVARLSQFDLSLIIHLKSLLCVTAGEFLQSLFAVLCQEVSKSCLDGNQTGLHATLKLVAIILADSEHQKLLSSAVLPISELLKVLEQTATIENWIPPFLLLVESMISYDDEPTESEFMVNAVGEITEPVEKPRKAMSISNEERQMLMTQVIRILSMSPIDNDNLHSLLRLTVRLTRDYELAKSFVQQNGVPLLFNKAILAQFPFQQSLVMGILRHCIESPKLLRQMMENELYLFFTHPRVKTFESNNFFKGIGHIICRSPTSFEDAARQVCRLESFDPKNPQSMLTAKPIEAIKLGRNVDHGNNPVTHSLLNFFIQKLFDLKAPDYSQEPLLNVHVQRLALLQCLTELSVVSASCRYELITMSQKRSQKQTPRTSSTKNTFLNYLLHDLVPIGLDLVDQAVSEFSEKAYKIQESTWAIYLISSLCMKDDVLNDSPECKERIEFVRGVVLDSILRSLKDTMARQDVPFDIRYGKLVSCAELCRKILNLSKIASNDTNEAELLALAKAMIEREFPSFLTAAIADLDILHPLSGKVVQSVLRSIDILANAAISLGKNNDLPTLKHKKSIANSFDKAFRDLENEELTEDHAEITNLYRNSALGIMEPDSATDSEMESDEDEEIDFDTDDEDEESGEENSSEDEMEIIVPEPYQGAHLTEVSPYEETSEDENVGEVVVEEVGEDENEVDWEDMSEEEEAEEPEVRIDLEEGFPLTEDEMEEGGSDDESQESEDMYENFDDDDILGNLEASQRVRNMFIGDIGNTADLPWMRNSQLGPGLLNDIIQSTTETPFGRTRVQRIIPTEEISHPLLVSQAPSNSLNPFGQFRLNLSHMQAPPTYGADYSAVYESLSGRSPNRGLFSRQSGQNLLFENVLKTTEEPSLEQRQLKYLQAFSVCFADERWKQEARVYYGNCFNDMAKRRQNAVLNQLIPEALREREIKAAAEAAKMEEEEEERKQKEAKKLAEEKGELSEMQVDDAISQSEEHEGEAEDMVSERQVITVDGNEIDITGKVKLNSGMGIDVTFLEALPDEMRQEVINQHMQEQRVALGRSDLGSQLYPEFLAVLPASMREEVLEQERQQRERIAGAIRQAPAVVNPEKPKTSSSRESVQLLDSDGLSSLIRLIFAPDLTKTLLDKILISICENSKSRMELLTMLMSILTNDSRSLILIDRNFNFLTLQSIQQAGDQAVVDEQYGKMQSVTIQRTLEALAVMCKSVTTVGKFFLTDIDSGTFSRTPKSAKKSKGKERAGKNDSPVVTLLYLLENPMFLENPQVLEKLIELLATILRPLAHIAKKKFAQKEAKEGTGEDSEMMQDESIMPETPAKNDSASKDVQKDKNDIRLPFFPESSVKAVVNILKESACNNKTFQFTLGVIQHLCSYPENLGIIVNELFESAKSVSALLIEETETLIHVLNTTDGTIPAEALAPFSIPTSSQSKLLRILKTLDYLFTSKTCQAFTGIYLRCLPLKNVSQLVTEKSGPVDEDLKMKTLKELYESWDGALLWQTLGKCMAIIHERDDLIHVATVLLPFIEGYMVISKPNVILLKTKSKEQQGLPRVLVKQQSELQDNDTGSFVVFAEANKKIINAMVRNNPSLMNGSFSLLVQHPKVLEFDNKRTYFVQQLHKQVGARTSHPPININVRRKYVFEESYQQLQGKTGDFIRYGKLNVKFRDEEGIDAGGVTREWFSVLALQMFNPDYALFRPSAADKVTYQPNRASGINPDHLFYFKFVGRIIGKAIYDNYLLDAYFTRSFYKCIINAPVDHKDMEAIDPEFYKSLDWILNNDITDVLDLSFSVEIDDFGVQKVVDLKPDGRNIPVTESNKIEYIRLVTEQKLVVAIKEQIQAFLSGFHEIIPADLIRIFNEHELELLISGLPDIDIDDWKNNTVYTNYTSTSPQVQWFWRAVRSFSQEERAKLLQFATGTSKVPLGGFNQLQGSNGVQKFQIHKEFSSNLRLPSAHTCFNQVDLPEYESYEQLRATLITAISECGTGIIPFNLGFGFA